MTNRAARRQAERNGSDKRTVLRRVPVEKADADELKGLREAVNRLQENRESARRQAEAAVAAHKSAHEALEIAATAHDRELRFIRRIYSIPEKVEFDLKTEEGGEVFAVWSEPEVTDEPAVPELVADGV